MSERLASESVIIQSPMSVTGSTKRIMKLWRIEVHPALRWTLLLLAVVALLLIAWVVTIAWTVIFGILLIPWRLLRRGSRKRKRDEMRHREMMKAVQERDVA